jgi:hypothetical protein
LLEINQQIPGWQMDGNRPLVEDLGKHKKIPSIHLLELLVRIIK